MLKVTLRCTLTSFLLAAGALAGERDAEVARLKTLFTAERYIDRVRTLANDAWGGRGPGQPGSVLTQDYVAAQFKSAGLEPAGDNGTYFQEFEVRGGKQLLEDKAALSIAGIDRVLKLREDWVPFPFTASDEAEAPLAFAGFGIEAEEQKYNDFADFDPKDKALLIFRYEPKSADESAEFGGKTPSRHSLFIAKARVAADKGAKGLIVVNPPSSGPEDKLYSFSSGGAQQTSYPLPMANISRKVAEQLLAKAGMPNLETLEKQLTSDRKSLSRDMGLNVKLVPGVEPEVIKVRNVIGKLRGEGAPDEYIVVGAHHDHLGTTENASGEISIFNGADDNASGTSGVIELARVFGNEPRLRRSMLFMTFDAEEMGLLGSKHFVDNPTVPIESIKAMINLDMIGRMNLDKLTVYGIKSGDGFTDIVRRAADDLEVKYIAPAREGSLFGASDHASFYRRQIPVLFSFTGMHRQYHKPEDDWELIDAEGAAKLLRWQFLIIRDLGNLSEGPLFHNLKDAQEDEPQQAPEQAAEKSDKPSPHGDAENADVTPKMPSARLGIMPGYASDGQPGMMVDGVSDGGAAKKAGVKEGDRIIQMGTYKISDVYGYMEAMAHFKPGDTVELTIVREGKEEKISVKLEAPKPAGGN